MPRLPPVRSDSSNFCIAVRCANLQLGAGQRLAMPQESFAPKPRQGTWQTITGSHDVCGHTWSSALDSLLQAAVDRKLNGTSAVLGAVHAGQWRQTWPVQSGLAEALA